jgi:uncharacterized protein (TIGR00369 family)
VSFTPATSDFAERIRESFSHQSFMRTLGAELRHVGPGEVDIGFGFRDDLLQQDGFLHAGVLTSVADSACGYAAMSLGDADTNVLSVEFKINMLSPAAGERFLARGRVIRAGRTLIVCRASVVSITADGEKAIAEMLGTMMRLPRQPLGT